MKKSFHKGLALALSLILIMSVCLVGGLVTTAVTDNDNITVTQTIYAHDAINEESEIKAAIGDLSTNLLFGLNTYYLKKGSYTTSTSIFPELNDGEIATTGSTDWFNTDFYSGSS